MRRECTLDGPWWERYNELVNTSVGAAVSGEVLRDLPAPVALCCYQVLKRTAASCGVWSFAMGKALGVGVGAVE